MMAKLTPPRGKFGHHSGQVWPKDLSWPIIIQSNQENFKDERSELVLLNTR